MNRQRFGQRAAAALGPALVFALVMVGTAPLATALPRMSLTAGSPCATCHVSPQGAGARNEIGWGTELFTRAFGFADIGLPKLDETESNTLLGGKIALGIDTRIQIARLGRPKLDRKANAADATFSGFTPGTKPDLVAIPMQFQPYLTVIPSEWLTLLGSINASALDLPGKPPRRYMGQVPWEAAAILHGDPMLPTLRVGMIQPTIGIRHDDHTMLQRADAMDPRRPLIPAGYAEIGGEASWHPISWFRAEAGAYLNGNLRESSAAKAADPVAATKDGIAWNGRITLLPQAMDLGVNTWIGASAFGSGELLLINGFAGVGKNEWGSLMVEAASGRGANGYQTLALTALASYPIKEWLVAEARGEYATSDASLVAGAQTSTTKQLVLGLQFFPIPYVELRPEYRLIRVADKTPAVANEYILGQYTLQLHLFF